MAPITYIASNENHNSFFMGSFTYIASNAEYFLDSEKKDEVEVPVSVFSNGLSSLEAVVKYLKDQKELRLCEIAKLLNRDDRTVWNAYNEASKKTSVENIQPGSHFIPLSVCANRNLSILESIVFYLKEERGLRNCKIAALLNKDARTIWTVHSRAKKKQRKC